MPQYRNKLIILRNQLFYVDLVLYICLTVRETLPIRTAYQLTSFLNFKTTM